MFFAPDGFSVGKINNDVSSVLSHHDLWPTVNTGFHLLFEVPIYHLNNAKITVEQWVWNHVNAALVSTVPLISTESSCCRPAHYHISGSA